LTEATDESPPVVKTYLERVGRFTKEAEALGARSRLVSNFRGLCFGAMVITGIAALVRDEPGIWGWVSAALAILFIVLVSWHGRVIREEDLALRWVTVNKDAVTRNGPNYRDLEEDGSRFINAVHPYADDLDLFGHASLFQRINTARTQFGQQRLASYLMNRATPEEVAARQEAARELAPLLELRQKLEALALAVTQPLGKAAKRTEGNSKANATLDPEPLLAWAENKPGLSNKTSFVVVAWVAPLVTVSIVVAAWVLSWHPLAWIGPLIAQAILLMSVRVHVGAVFAAVSANQGVFLRFGPMLELLETLEASAERLRELKEETQSADHEPPSVAMRQFERIVSWFELRHNGLVHPFVNGVLLWDVHCVLRLEAWQRRSGRRLRKWFMALGELEALASLAAYAHDNPSFCWPEVRRGEARFEAVGLGHPLLAPSARVVNDVLLEGPGKGLLVTGSNMSGKSTLLRAIGANTVLALSGSVVCAKKMVVTPLAVRTSMRIRDSLDEGVSHFYAELRKLKGVLDSLKADVPVLFLLDEILHGTNSRERQIGARWVLGHLLENGAMGAVSTHDSGLCELPAPLMADVRQVHLRETEEAGQLVFDYKLREGPVRSGNALRLMRSLGINVPLESQEGPTQ
jgi:ABC-type multidrug transport system fused ATPase/permease subunit